MVLLRWSAVGGAPSQPLWGDLQPARHPMGTGFGVQHTRHSLGEVCSSAYHSLGLLLPCVCVCVSLTICSNFLQNVRTCSNCIRLQICPSVA